jgi:ubiquitin-protein ligase
MYQSPRMRRLRNDLAALERLQSDSSVFRFTSVGDPPQHYRLLFLGRGLWRDRGKVRMLEKHHVEIKLGSSYPRTIPEIRWLTPVYHPNISEIGMVCLGGYGTHWVPSVQLDELCTMLWDMLRYHNYDIRSPYNRDAALWVAQQQTFRFPTDERPLRDLRAALGRIATDAADAGRTESPQGVGTNQPAREAPVKKALGRVRNFAQRYGQVFGIQTEETSSRRPAAADASRLLPSNSELHDLVAAQTAATAPGHADSQNEPVFILEPDSPVDGRPNPGPPLPAEGTSAEPLFARPPRDATTPRDDAVDVSAEVRRLLRADRGPAGSPSEEIVFID